MTLFGEEEELDHFLVEEHLGERGVALYTSMHRDEGTFHAIMAEAVKKGDSIGINGRDYTIYPGLCYDNIVADRAITIYLALIVPDELYGKLAREPEAYCRNVHLADEVTDKLGLMQAIQKMETELAGTGIEYDSFLGWKWFLLYENQ